VSAQLLADDEEEEIAQARLAMSLAEGTGNPSNLAAASCAPGLDLASPGPGRGYGGLRPVLAPGQERCWRPRPPGIRVGCDGEAGGVPRQRRSSPKLAQRSARGGHPGQQPGTGRHGTRHRRRHILVPRGGAGHRHPGWRSRNHLGAPCDGRTVPVAGSACRCAMAI
jgi:hypothetical protein